MANEYFPKVESIPFEGPNSSKELAYHYYDKDQKVLGKTMEEHLRPAVCYWHNFAWPGSDVFGEGTFSRPWHQAGDPMELAKHKLNVAFEFFEKLGLRYFTFHDRDIAPEGETLAESHKNLDLIVELMAEKMQKTNKELLWGTANCFSNKRYMSGASTNPDPEVFAYAGAQIKKAIDVTKQLGGHNYVLWGGREGYESLLNTNISLELDNMARLLSMVADYKHKIGFKGRLLIEPKPKEPTKHQYDFDTATVFGFLKKYGLEKEYQVNIEANHAILSGHTFQHEIEVAFQSGIFGSIDMNRGDSLLGWDTDQFPIDLSETALVLLVILENGGMGSGGMNFDAKLRRQSIDPEDLFHAHICGMDTLARALLVAEKMLNDGKLKALKEQRYAGWKQELGQKITSGLSLEELSDLTLQRGLNPKPRSGRQEALEALVNRYLTL